MASLQQLLTEEGFEGSTVSLKNRKPVKPRDRIPSNESTALFPINICHDPRSLQPSKQKTDKTVKRKGSSVFSSEKAGSDSGVSDSKSLVTNNNDEPAIDEVVMRAVVSILSGYIGRYIKDESFREMIREKCNTCLMKKMKDSDNGIFANMELGIDTIEKLVFDKGTKQELIRMQSLRNCIRVLSIVASLNSEESRNGSTCGVPNSHLSACAQLYLSIVYKLEKNDRISARHLLQVFCDSPFLARTHLLPDLWEHFFLPHLLHLKVWYHMELEFLSNSDYSKKEKRMKILSKVYNDYMNIGTAQFALYYKDWLRVGVVNPTIPDVPLPSKPSYGSSRRRSSDSSTSHSSINKSLYQTVFGPALEKRSIDLCHRNRASIDTWGLEEEEEEKEEEEEEEKVSIKQDNYNFNYVNNKTRTRRRSSSQITRTSQPELWPETQKSEYLRLFNCQGVPTGSVVIGNTSIRKKEKDDLLLTDLSQAITTICSSDSCSDSELAIRVITTAWLDSHGDPSIEAALWKPRVIEALLELLSVSNDEEILELLIAILAEFVTKSDLIRLIILDSDPHLDIFIRLLNRSSLFLKAAVLLYLLKPKAKQMISMVWMPLVLRVLEFGDQLQTLFTVRCSTREAAFYFLDQLLQCFDEDRNLENARQVVQLGGLSLLVRCIEIGDVMERNNAALMISCCIQADGRCRNYLAENLNKASLIELIVYRHNDKFKGYAFALLAELLCLERRTQITKFLHELKIGWRGLNTMHVLLAYLHRAQPEERPIVAAILLQLDLLGDPLKFSVYREEAVDVLVEALDCQIGNEKVQEQSARALLMLGSRFSYTGEGTEEDWLLQQASPQESSRDVLQYNKEAATDSNLTKEEEAIGNWHKKTAIALLNSGNQRFLAALSNSIANGIPNLARASLFTVAWISSSLHGAGDEKYQSMACSILRSQLLESSNYDRALEEMGIASISLLHLTNS
ncbi:hypothetical protein CFOL_v3_05787 [Cephalotus follicularis]|uniref:Uncharacterized protein n=1 Tax=Cephalotus follicularis TaxID=3775 RepID=A0A1Q3B362_CEPFO|nr:hypothetical protein CFOL_v3_05787 [Cephalotus follicularis]